MVILIIYLLVFGNKYSVVIVKVDRIILFYMIYFVFFIIDKLNFILLYFVLFIYKNRS